MTSLLYGPAAWQDAAVRSAAVPDESVGALWRALNYLSAAQLYLVGNLRGTRKLAPGDIKARPRGHWGVCPPVNWMLAHLGPISAHRTTGTTLAILHGAGHASPAALAHAYLTRQLDRQAPEWSMDALRQLIIGFPHTGTYGSEISPLIADACHTGGQLGATLAVAQGMVLDAPHRLAIPLIGDGECETGATAASWLAAQALRNTGDHGLVLPVVLLNGLRMGAPSLLSRLSRDQVRDYFTGLGYTAFVHQGNDVASFRALLAQALTRLQPLGSDGPHPLIVLTMPKGFTGPRHVGGKPVLGTPVVHKTPLSDPRHRPEELAVLQDWLAAYRPVELLTEEGAPTALVRRALPGETQPRARVTLQPSPDQGGDRPADLRSVIVRRAAKGPFRMFSPDELSSNRLAFADGAGQPPWVVEILNEEVCHAWLQGYTETGRNALLATYEAFAPINTSLLAQHLKHRRLKLAAGHSVLLSINYLITSLGWNNTYTHQNPGLISAMLELQDPSVHVYTPADATRAAAVLQKMLNGTGQANFLVASKHPVPLHPADTIPAEIEHGIAIWKHLTDPGEPDIVLASAGDIPARELSAAAGLLRTQRPSLHIRYLHINDLTVLGPPATWPSGLSDASYGSLFADVCPVLLATIGCPGAVRALIAHRGDADRFYVVGYQDPGSPVSQGQLLGHAGMSADALASTALRIVKEPSR